MADPFSAFAGGFGSAISGAQALFGTSGTTNTSGTSSSITESEANITGEARDRLDISDEAIDKIVTDILQGPDGLASIFSGEQNAGVFNSSVSAQAAGDLTAKITGEIAKLRAERVQTQERTQTQTQTTEAEQQSKTKEKKDGLLSKIFG